VPQWEYLFVRFDYFAGDLRPQNANGEEIRDERRQHPLHEYANYLGEQGWEMVNFNFSPAYGYGFLTLKRIKGS
jgi:hypothetical protein